MAAYLSIILKYATYLVGIIGMIAVFANIGFSFRNVKARYKINRKKRSAIVNTKWLKITPFRQYNHLLASAFPKYQYHMFYKVLLYHLTGFIFVLVINLTITGNRGYSILTALLVSYGIPIGYAYFRHKQIQSLLQEHITDATVELLKSYQRSHNNMLYALKDVSEELDGKLGVIFAKMFARMHDDDEIKEMAIETFAFQLGRLTRAKNLSVTILKACKDGSDVEILLNDIVKDMSNMKMRAREAETESAEVAYMGYLPLPMTFALIYLNDRFLIKGEALHYHFNTPEGFQVFMWSMILGVINLGLAIMVKRPSRR
ncbi:hypothetical protein GLW08_20475 [Pontibacillus yanchengensis]|uniref:Type II secretion system protein GspF domain-containing protein n=2 Tax=Pontibacillus yanchengensis TaxID=462910 RepID=A0A6I5A560_9BACI|nr:hypothetical protein [Pontibacillus yanchengensis]MYL35481.1 hypothetical protein [Pontibacillus yanchengensis]MYL55681.1 hypothetical protein [Pontibacillus yanchengensis]